MARDLEELGRRPLTVEDGEALWEALRQVSDRLEDVADGALVVATALELLTVLTAKAKDGRDRQRILDWIDEARSELSAIGDKETTL